MNNQQNVLVVGGGVAGLTTAVYLARAGLSVTVYEKARQVGGRATSQEKADFVFNQGPHALYLQGAGRAILDDLGVQYSGKKPQTVKKSWGIKNGRLHLLPGDPLSILQTDLLTLGGKAGLAKFVSQLMKINPQDVAHMTARHWLETAVSDPNIRLIITMLGRVATYAHAPDSFSAEVLVQQLQYALGDNVLYLDGGWQRLVDGLRAVAESAGVTIVTGERITAVSEHPDHTTVLTASGEQLIADVVVMALSPAELAELLPTHPQVLQWRDTAVPIKVATLDVALNQLPNRKNLLAFGLDAPTYFSVHSHFAALAPRDRAMIHVMKYLAPDESSEGARAELESLLDLVQTGWRNHLVHSRYLPEMTVTHWLALAEDGGRNGRPPIQIPGQTRLFIAGDWIGTDGWLADASFASAKAVAEAVFSNRYSVVGV